MSTERPQSRLRAAGGDTETDTTDSSVDTTQAPVVTAPTGTRPGGSYAVGAGDDSGSDDSPGPREKVGQAVAVRREQAEQLVAARRTQVEQLVRERSDQARRQLEQVQARFQERPELELGAALAGGFVVAQIIRLFRRRGR